MFAQLGYYICVPFAWLTRLFYTWTGSYGVALILFTLLVKLVLLPFQLKSKKSMLRMNRMQSKIKDIQTRYANNREKQQQEMADLYAREGVNPMSGCLWSFLPFPILIALYYIIRTPLRYFMSLSQSVIAEITTLATSLGYVAATEGQAAAYEQIYLAKFIHEHWADFDGKFAGLIDLNYNFLGMDLSAVGKDLFSQFPSGGWPVIGILIMIVLILEALYFAHKEKWPKAETKHTAGEIGKIFLEAVPALMTPVIILGGIYSGLFTATESAAVACVWAFIAGVFIYKEIKIADLIPILMKSAKSAAMILFIIAASTAFSWVFTFSGASAALVQLVVSMNLNKTLFCLVVAIILLIFGTFMEGTAIAVLLVPVLWPIAESMGINVIHFGMILCISNVIGTMTPPVAVNIFSAVQVTRSVRELKIGEISKAEIPFFIGYVAVFFLCVFSETFCTFLIR